VDANGQVSWLLSAPITQVTRLEVECIDKLPIVGDYRLRYAFSTLFLHFFYRLLELYRVSCGCGPVHSLRSGVGFCDVGCSTKRSSPLGFDSGWKWAERGVELPSSQNSTSPSALSEPLLTRSPFSRIRSSIVTDLSENICGSQCLGSLHV
jgi:hypothetical protein